MILNSDSYFSIGSLHKHCDDFAINGITSYDKISDTVYAIISDGCSSSKGSNMGSMILSTTAAQCNFANENLYIDEVLFRSRTVQGYLGLNNNCLDATLFALTINNDFFHIKCYGDGAIIKIRNDDTVEFTYIEYPSGAPLYINYYKNPERYELYKKQFGLQRKIYKYKFIDNVVTDFESNVDESGSSFLHAGYCENYKAIFVASDGISSFIGENKSSIDITLVVRALCDFKSYKGEFIQRRMNGFNNYCQKQGWKHTDDFSIAGIHVSNE